MYLIMCFSDFGYIYPFRSYWRSKSKVVKNRAEFLPSQVLLGQQFQNYSRNAEDTDGRAKVIADKHRPHSC